MHAIFSQVCVFTSIKLLLGNIKHVIGIYWAWKYRPLPVFIAPCVMKSISELIKTVNLIFLVNI